MGVGCSLQKLFSLSYHPPSSALKLFPSSTTIPLASPSLSSVPSQLVISQQRTCLAYPPCVVRHSPSPTSLCYPTSPLQFCCLVRTPVYIHAQTLNQCALLLKEWGRNQAAAIFKDLSRQVCVWPTAQRRISKINLLSLRRIHNIHHQILDEEQYIVM